MISTRLSILFVAALLASSACAPVRAMPLAPAPAPARVVLAPSAGFEAELLGYELAMPEAPIVATRRDLLGGAEYDLPLVANSWVEAELDFLVEERRDVIARWLERGDHYQAFIEAELRASGVPTDLFHVAMIESAFVPTARSRAGAVGLWQFMPPTARELGLRIDATVDERMDPVRSTRAAGRHLRFLRRSLGDWALAAAAYNAGSGRISRGLQRFGATDFWELAERGDLAQETRQYVPRLYAVTVIARDRERFGFPRPAASGFAFDSIQVEYATPFAELAKLGGVTEEQLARLNPHLLGRATPEGAYWLWVPAGTGPALQRAWLASDFRRGQGHGTYTVRSGDTLGELAERAGVRSARIRELNPGIDFDRLQIGASLRLPYLAARALTAGESVAVADAPRDAGARKREHVVRSGDSLWAIAREYGTSVAAIETANGLGERPIQPGQRLTVPTLN